MFLHLDVYFNFAWLNYKLFFRKERNKRLHANLILVLYLTISRKLSEILSVFCLENVCSAVGALREYAHNNSLEQ